ncbi:hypothetical protein [Methylobacterium frigidaeris]|uniref:Uncharacterized protein n=1 Tax=Methylobacterium frigidaeris TaxID=2038277 RepID=A0AA37H7B5_9HYPH|nr:hypothetical protein [Methylobacterium frigidaeris]PIK74486.1 hypothetical protein CS379_02285 [Methylobacterium frigidaeris]GJD60708.1 hypothetical protein MPEAHAMD_0847 [Methylobacterium frigidaeris]
MRLLRSSTAVAGLAAAAALALHADVAALVLLALWCGLALLAIRRDATGEGALGGSGGPWIRVALALALAWRAPGGPAAAFAAALLLEIAVARLTALAAARTGATLPGPDLHSLILAGGRAADIVAALAFAALILWPDRLPLIASALAGLTAMGAIARASLALAVVRGIRDEA